MLAVLPPNASNVLRLFRPLFLIVLITLLSACGGGGSAVEEDTSVALDPPTSTDPPTTDQPTIQEPPEQPAEPEDISVPHDTPRVGRWQASTSGSCLILRMVIAPISVGWPSVPMPAVKFISRVTIIRPIRCFIVCISPITACAGSATRERPRKRRTIG